MLARLTRWMIVAGLALAATPVTTFAQPNPSVDRRTRPPPPHRPPRGRRRRRRRSVPAAAAAAGTAAAGAAAAGAAGRHLSDPGAAGAARGTPRSRASRHGVGRRPLGLAERNWTWQAGRWEREQPGKRWQAGRWDRRGNRYEWVADAWIDVPAYPTEAPPPPRPQNPGNGRAWCGSRAAGTGRTAAGRGLTAWENERRASAGRPVAGIAAGDRYEWVADTWIDVPVHPTEAPPPPRRSAPAAAVAAWSGSRGAGTGRTAAGPGRPVTGRRSGAASTGAHGVGSPRRSLRVGRRSVGGPVAVPDRAAAGAAARARAAARWLRVGRRPASEWRNNEYVWVPGHWERAKANAQWVDGRWELQGQRVRVGRGRLALATASHDPTHR